MEGYSRNASNWVSRKSSVLWRLDVDFAKGSGVVQCFLLVVLNSANELSDLLGKEGIESVPVTFI